MGLRDESTTAGATDNPFNCVGARERLHDLRLAPTFKEREILDLVP
jgi:hypothetical protein